MVQIECRRQGAICRYQDQLVFVVQDWWSPYQGIREAQLTEVQGVDGEPFKVKTVDLISVAPPPTKLRFARLDIDALKAILGTMADD